MSIRGRIARYLYREHFGFLLLQGGPEVFFHVRGFVREPGGPGPILGEEVTVSEVLTSGKGPWVERVERVSPPVECEGTVKSFDQSRGWGFIVSEGETLFFHRQELSGSWVPLPGMRVRFYRGNSPTQARGRACWVEKDT